MRYLIAAIFLLQGSFPCFAVIDINACWQKGVGFYEQKQYDSAAGYFEQIAALKPDNPEVYYNLGNIYYRLNKIAPSVLNYERALKLRPGYQAAAENLSLAQSRINNAIAPVHDIFFVAWWHDVTRADKAKTWDITALVLFTLMFLVMLVRRLRPATAVPGQIVGLLLFGFICFLALAFFASQNTNPHTAVVMQSDVPLMNADLKGKPLVLVPEGTTVQIKSENGMWAQVTLPDGRTGWIQEILMDKI